MGGHSPKKKKKLEAALLVVKRKASRCSFVKKGDPMFSTPWDPAFFIEPRTPLPHVIHYLNNPPSCNNFSHHGFQSFRTNDCNIVEGRHPCHYKKTALELEKTVL